MQNVLRDLLCHTCSTLQAVHFAFALSCSRHSLQRPRDLRYGYVPTELCSNASHLNANRIAGHAVLHVLDLAGLALGRRVLLLVALLAKSAGPPLRGSAHAVSRQRLTSKCKTYCGTCCATRARRCRPCTWPPRSPARGIACIDRETSATGKRPRGCTATCLI